LSEWATFEEALRTKQVTHLIVVFKCIANKLGRFTIRTSEASISKFRHPADGPPVKAISRRTVHNPPDCDHSVFPSGVIRSASRDQARETLWEITVLEGRWHYRGKFDEAMNVRSSWCLSVTRPFFYDKHEGKHVTDLSSALSCKAIPHQFP